MKADEEGEGSDEDAASQCKAMCKARADEGGSNEEGPQDQGSSDGYRRPLDNEGSRSQGKENEDSNGEGQSSKKRYKAQTGCKKRSALYRRFVPFPFVPKPYPGCPVLNEHKRRRSLDAADLLRINTAGELAQAAARPKGPMPGYGPLRGPPGARCKARSFSCDYKPYTAPSGTTPKAMPFQYGLAWNDPAPHSNSLNGPCRCGYSAPTHKASPPKAMQANAAMKKTAAPQGHECKGINEDRPQGHEGLKAWRPR